MITQSDQNRQEGEAAAPGELTPYVAPLPVPPVLRPASGDVLRETEIALRPTWVRLHPQLPPTLMWGYDGRVPGPTIEVRRRQRVRIAWTNRIPKGSEYPVTSVEVLPPAATVTPGREGAEPNKDVAALPAFPADPVRPTSGTDVSILTVLTARSAPAESCRPGRRPPVCAAAPSGAAADFVDLLVRTASRS